VRYVVVDAQWVPSEQEASGLVRMLLSAAAGHGMAIGMRHDGYGYLVTVEKVVNSADAKAPPSFPTKGLVQE
jgi:hypothetical protein